MVQIVLTDEQVMALNQAGGDVEFRDSRGQSLGYFWHGWTAEDIAKAKAALKSDQRRYTTEEVLNHLQSLESK